MLNQTDDIAWLEKSISEEHIECYNYYDFKDIRKIGRGSSGDVFRVTWNNTIFALKSFINNEQTIKEFVKEVLYFLVFD